MRRTIGAYGSPPRAWGQSLPPFAFPFTPRFTPTRVGTISQPLSGLPLPAVHPHARGDNISGSVADDYPNGSPPRAWGQFTRAIPQLRENRFTPTRVGTMCTSPSRPGAFPVHPHARGDNQPSRAALRPSCGSPPRAWGQCRQGAGSLGCHRFTPTRVGTMASLSMPSSVATVHPHARGDNSSISLNPLAGNGSPPRAWGQYYACMPKYT